MDGLDPGNIFLADCPARLAVEVIADKWAVVVLWGLVDRQDFGGVPPRVEYELTDLGRTLMGPIRMLTMWAEENGEAVLAAQEGG